MGIYITNVAEYNTGRLIGQRIELPCTKEELQDAMSRFLCLGEECFITDSDGIPFDVNEYDNPFRPNEKLCVAFLLSEGYDWTYIALVTTKMSLCAYKRALRTLLFFG